MTDSGIAALTAPRALQVDLDEHRPPRVERLLDRRPRGAGPLQAAVDLGPLQQLAALDQLVEAGRADEVVVASVDLAGRGGRGWSPTR